MTRFVDVERFETALRVARHLIEDNEKHAQEALSREDYAKTAYFETYGAGMQQILVVFENLDLLQASDRDVSRNNSQAESKS